MPPRRVKGDEMRTTTLTLADFLLARIAEDEARAREPDVADQPHVGECAFDVIERVAEDCYCGLPARVLAECEAKRLLIELGFRHAAMVDGEWGCCHDAEAIRTGVIKAQGDWEEDEPLPETCTAYLYALPHLQALALPYADHPDFREEWRA